MNFYEICEFSMLQKIYNESDFLKKIEIHYLELHNSSKKEDEPYFI